MVLVQHKLRVLNSARCFCCAWYGAVSLCVALYRHGLCANTLEGWRTGGQGAILGLSSKEHETHQLLYASPSPGRFPRLQPVLIISLCIQSPMLAGQQLIKDRWTKCLGNESLFREIRHTWEDAIKEGGCLQPHVLIYLHGQWYLDYGANNPSSECSSRPALENFKCSGYPLKKTEKE